MRPTTQPERLKAQLEGTAIYRTPISIGSLLQSFQGRYYMDVTGDTPSERQQQQDLFPTTVLQAPSTPGATTDSWSLVESDGKRILIRRHVLPRLALFNPQKVTVCPVSMDELRGARVTHAKLVPTGETVQIKDTIEDSKTLQDRWTGETHFELKEIIVRPAKVRRGVPSKPKQKAAEDLPRLPRGQADGSAEVEQPGEAEQD